MFFGIRFSVDLSRSSNYSISINWRSKQRKLSGQRCSFLSESILMWWLIFVKTLRLKLGEYFCRFLNAKISWARAIWKMKHSFEKKKLNERHRLPRWEKKWLAILFGEAQSIEGKMNPILTWTTFEWRIT